MHGQEAWFKNNLTVMMDFQLIYIAWRAPSILKICLDYMYIT